MSSVLLPPSSLGTVSTSENDTTSFIVALSGPTSSGKTTIATALTSIFPVSTIHIIHADDFYKSDSKIPIHSTGVQDWDCAEALDLIKFRQTLLNVRAGATVPDQVVKQGAVQDHVDTALSSLDKDLIENLSSGVASWPAALAERRVIIVEGFLLFGQGVQQQLSDLFDLKILLRSTREAAQRRRASRNGYVTLEGFWQDPEGYFEDVVWPNYEAEHAFLFDNGDVEGEVKRSEDGLEKDIVMVGPLDHTSLEELCQWVLKCINIGLERQ